MPERGNTGFNKHQELINRMKEADPQHASGWEELGDFATFLSRSDKISRSALDPKIEQSEPIVGSVYSHKYFDFDMRAHTVTVEGNTVELTKMNYDLLKYLVVRRNHIVSRTELIENVWENYGSPRTVDVHMVKMRKILSGSREMVPDLIRTFRGVGYMLYDETAELGRSKA